MVKEQAELFGWKAVIEERIPRTLESVDLGLKKDDVRAAIEICSTTKPDQEIQNIRKCLNAGYDYVVSVSPDEKNLAAIKSAGRKSFRFKEKERLRFFLPSQVKNFLQGFDLPAVVSDQISREKQLLNISEAAELLGIRKNTLYEWVVQRKIPYIKVGRLVKFRKEDLEAWIEDRFKAEKKNYVD